MSGIFLYTACLWDVTNICRTKTQTFFSLFLFTLWSRSSMHSQTCLKQSFPSFCNCLFWAFLHYYLFVFPPYCYSFFNHNTVDINKFICLLLKKAFLALFSPPPPQTQTFSYSFTVYFWHILSSILHTFFLKFFLSNMSCKGI
jgi:hypothetical protein